MPTRPPVPQPESAWTRRLREPGWLLLPLRGFLGVTFVFAGLQKLANPNYFDPHSASSVAAQMRSVQGTSPIGPLLGLSVHAPTPVGLLIAFGELAVGLGALLGLYVRVAALGGALLSLAFFLTVSWNTTPYYYGSDIVFLFCWITLIGFGTGGVLSLDGWLRNRARASLRLGPQPADIAISAVRLRSLCSRGGQCGLQPDGECVRVRGCPVFPVDERLSPGNRDELRRRTVLRTGAAAAVTAAGAVTLGGVTAALGRAAGGTRHAPAALTPPRHAAPRPTHHSAAAPGGGTVVGSTSQVPLRQAREFRDPATGAPAWMVHPSGSTFVAFSAVCTHAGCTVQYDASSQQFVCPCHGGTFDARTGQVLQGPPPAPLQKIPVQVVAGKLRVGG